MDTQNDLPGDSAPKTTVPETSSSRTALTGLLVIVVLGIVIALAVYLTGNWPSSPSPINSSSTIDESGIAWQSLVGENPTTVLITTSNSENAGYTSTYGAYQIGTFKEGQYAGSKLYIAALGYSNTPATDIGSYVYYIGDSAAKPIAWWQYAGPLYEGMGEPDVPTSLTDAPVLASSTLPIKFYGYMRVLDSKGAPITVSEDLVVPSNPAAFTAVGTTLQGAPILKSLATPSSTPFNDIQQYDYYAETPFGALYPLTLEPDFINQDSYNNPASLTWQTGSTTVATYNYGHYLYGISDCFTSFKDVASIEASFVQTGTTKNGDPVYEINPVGHDDVYQCLYPKTQRYDYDPVTQKTTSYYPTTYKEFLTTHSVFFWKHPYGDWMAFGRSDVVPAAEKAKPVIYLYPTQTEKVSVKVDPVGGFTKTDPAYGNGWNVSATPQGVLSNLQDGKTYPYLFWEGGKEGVVATPQQGFVVKQSDISALLNDKLALFGLNKKERTDFIEFWKPRLSQAPYYFITFISRNEIDRVAPLSISPKPDTVIRVLMDYKPLNAPVAVDPLQIRQTPRSGFTAVEWGGIIR